MNERALVTVYGPETDHGLEGDQFLATCVEPSKSSQMAQQPLVKYIVYPLNIQRSLVHAVDAVGDMEIGAKIEK